MQTVLQWGKKRPLLPGEKSLVMSFSFYLERFYEWRELKADKRALQSFEALHGRAFVESLEYFEKILG